ncbi:MAG: PadR family transcriptional regulator [Lachnospirales bacterium]
MRILKYAILGLLSKREMTGYEISKEFGREVSEFWFANHSQIYPELKKLDKEKLVEYKVEIVGDLLESKRYTITEKGREDFLEWLNEEATFPKAPKDVFRLKTYFSYELSPEVRLRFLQNHLDLYHKRLILIENEAKNYNNIPAFKDERYGDYIILKSCMYRVQANIQWLEDCIVDARKNIAKS